MNPKKLEELASLIASLRNARLGEVEALNRFLLVLGPSGEAGRQVWRLQSNGKGEWAVLDSVNAELKARLLEDGDFVNGVYHYRSWVGNRGSRMVSRYKKPEAL